MWPIGTSEVVLRGKWEALRCPMATDYALNSAKPGHIHTLVARGKGTNLYLFQALNWELYGNYLIKPPQNSTIWQHTHFTDKEVKVQSLRLIIQICLGKKKPR